MGLPRLALNSRQAAMHWEFIWQLGIPTIFFLGYRQSLRKIACCWGCARRLQKSLGQPASTHRCCSLPKAVSITNSTKNYTHASWDVMHRISPADHPFSQTMLQTHEKIRKPNITCSVQDICTPGKGPVEQQCRHNILDVWDKSDTILLMSDGPAHFSSCIEEKSWDFCPTRPEVFPQHYNNRVRYYLWLQTKV